MPVAEFGRVRARAPVGSLYCGALRLGNHTCGGTFKRLNVPFALSRSLMPIPDKIPDARPIGHVKNTAMTFFAAINTHFAPVLFGQVTRHLFSGLAA